MTAATQIAGFQTCLTFPRCDGSDPQAWIRKCDKFFIAFNTNADDKVKVASLCLDGKAEVWFSVYKIARPDPTWVELQRDICYVGNFNNLTQSGSVDDYIKQFQELNSNMLNRNPGLSEKYFVSCFLSGLKDNIRSRVQMCEPDSLDKALDLARKQEGIVAKSGAARLGASGNEDPNKPIPVWLFVLIGFLVVVLFLSAIPTGIGFASSTMVIFLLVGIAWWVVGLYWIISGGKKLMDDDPLLFWLMAVLLGMGAVLGATLYMMFVYMLFGTYWQNR